MVKSNRTAILIFGVLLSIFSGCSRDKLERNIRKELATGTRHDSLFVGLEFGMTLQEFYDHCWKLNRQGLVTEGPENMTVQYLFKDSLDQPVAFNFYPRLNVETDMNDTIHHYNTTFSYYAWAPWNQHLQSDDLIKILDKVLMDWYGGNKIFSQVKNGEVHYFKIDGNRMIEFFILNERKVAVNFVNLANPEQLKDYLPNE